MFGNHKQEITSVVNAARALLPKDKAFKLVFGNMLADRVHSLQYMLDFASGNEYHRIRLQRPIGQPTLSPFLPGEILHTSSASFNISTDTLHIITPVRGRESVLNSFAHMLSVRAKSLASSLRLHFIAAVFPDTGVSKTQI